MNEEEIKWLTIIPTMPKAEFEIFVKRWRDENKSVLESFDARRFRVEVIRTVEGDRLRLLMELK